MSSLGSSASGCAGPESAWHLVAWQFVGIACWLLYLVLSDTKEREKIAQSTTTVLSLQYRTRTVMWLGALCAGSLGAGLLWLRRGWGGAPGSLLLYFVLLFFTVIAWRQFWVVHRFLITAIASLVATLVALAATLAFLVQEPQSGLLLLPYVAVQGFETVYAWLFYRANREQIVGSRDVGRMQEPPTRANANSWILVQNPAQHIVQAPPDAMSGPPGWVPS